MRVTLYHLFLIGLVAVSAGCSRGPLNVSTIQVGRSLNSDNSVGSHTTRFKPQETIYAAVLTTNSGSSTIVARWTYSGKVIQEQTKNVSYRGEAATEFHLEYAGNLPAGDYRVEILVDGESVGTRDFRVES